jgi:hypothetical protein
MMIILLVPTTQRAVQLVEYVVHSYVASPVVVVVVAAIVRVVILIMELRMRR